MEALFLPEKTFRRSQRDLCFSWSVLCLSKGPCIGLRGVFSYLRGPCLVSEGPVFSSGWSFPYLKWAFSNLGWTLSGLGWALSDLGWAPSGLGMGPFKPGTGPLGLTKSFFFVLFFLFFDNLVPFEKIVGQIRLVFDFGWGSTLGPPGAWPPLNENPATANDPGRSHIPSR